LARWQIRADLRSFLRRELDEAMLLCGCTTLANIDESLLRP
jgi:isopentenyl diphosphate isomerase/L-lactate dehydrogenase-like FMN-dependent dehydrogenase